MTTGTIITPIWDYGWLAGDDVEFPPAASDREILERYVSSPAFPHFVPSIGQGRDWHPRPIHR